MDDGEGRQEEEGGGERHHLQLWRVAMEHITGTKKRTQVKEGPHEFRSHL